VHRMALHNTNGRTTIKVTNWRELDRMVNNEI
jgi:hypothetical protein